MKLIKGRSLVDFLTRGLSTSRKELMEQHRRPVCNRKELMEQQGRPVCKRSLRAGPAQGLYGSVNALVLGKTLYKIDKNNLFFPHVFGPSGRVRPPSWVILCTVLILFITV